MKIVLSLLAWLVMLLVAIANGALRDFTFGKHLSELHAHQLSSLIGCALLGMVMWFFVSRWPPASERTAFALGLFWMVLTMAFEFLFFHYASGRAWAELIADYNLLQGRVWVLVLAWVALAPWLFYRFGGIVNAK